MRSCFILPALSCQMAQILSTRDRRPFTLQPRKIIVFGKLLIPCEIPLSSLLLFCHDWAEQFLASGQRNNKRNISHKNITNSGFYIAFPIPSRRCDSQNHRRSRNAIDLGRFSESQILDSASYSTVVSSFSTYIWRSPSR